jgi:hypothetical protein
MKIKTCLRLAFALCLAAGTLGLVGPAAESEAVLKCPRTYCSSLACPSTCTRRLGPCTACTGGNGTPARYFQCVSSTGAACVPAQYCLDPSCLG